jgi:hypothetical protein
MRFEVPHRAAGVVVDVHDGGRGKVVGDVRSYATVHERRCLTLVRRRRLSVHAARRYGKRKCFVLLGRDAWLMQRHLSRRFVGRVWFDGDRSDCLAERRRSHLLAGLNAHRTDDLISRLVGHAADARRLLTG